MLAHVIATARALQPAGIHVVYGHGGDAVLLAFDGPIRCATGPNRPSASAPATRCSRRAQRAARRARAGAVRRRAADRASTRCNGCSTPPAALRCWSPTWPIRPATAASCATPKAASAGSSSTRTPTTEQRAIRTGQHRHPRRRRRAAAALARASRQRQRPGRVLPDRRLRVGGRANSPRPRWCTCTIRSKSKARTTRGSWRSWSARSSAAPRARCACEGARLADPARIDIRGEVSVGNDVEIDVDVVLEGRVELADGVRIGPFCRLSRRQARARHRGARALRSRRRGGRRRGD